MVLAAALEVPPVELLFPDLPDGEVEALPGRVTTSWQAVQWFSGESQGKDCLVPGTKSDLLRRSRDWQEAREGLARAEYALKHSSDENRDEYRELVSLWLERVAFYERMFESDE